MDCIIDRIEWGKFLEALTARPVVTHPIFTITADTCVIHTHGQVIQYVYATEPYRTLLGNLAYRWNAERVWIVQCKS